MTDDRRAQVLEVAARLLADEGPHGLSLRRIAAEAGGSTQLIYTLFGGKPGLVDALYAEGFDRMAATTEEALRVAAPPGDPQRMVAFGLAYQRFALAEPAFFSVMFGRAVPGFTPRAQTRAEGRAKTMGRVVQAAQECLDAGTLAGQDATSLARMCWAGAHGLASLQVAGLLVVEEDFVERALQAQVRAHLPR